MYSIFGCLFWAAFWWAGYNNPINSIDINFSETKVLDVNQYKSLLDEITNNDSSKLNLYEISALIENHPYIKVARVSRHYPSEIKIEIIEREPIAIVNIEPMIFLDENGFVLPDEGNVNNYNLPVMNNFNSEPELYPLGKITLSVVTGICRSNLSYKKILLSSRNRTIANKLAKKFRKVSIGKNNQEILNSCNWIFLAVTTIVGQKIIKELMK